MDLFDRLSGLTQFGSLWILWLLVGLSVLALTVAIERAVLFFHRATMCLACGARSVAYSATETSRWRASGSNILRASKRESPWPVSILRTRPAPKSACAASNKWPG